MDSQTQLIIAEQSERRVIPTAGLCIETRAVSDAPAGADPAEYFSGCAVKFGVRSQDLGGFAEIIDQNAFAGCDMTDVVALVNHDNNLILGRTLAGTLTLELRAGDGLYFLIPVDNQDPDHLRYKRKIEKGEIRGCSFQFSMPDKSDSEKWDWEQSPYLRTVLQIKKLYDVGPVTFPAYTQTDTEIAKRSMDTAKAEHDRIANDAAIAAAAALALTEPATPAYAGTPLSTYQRRARLANLTRA